MISEVEIVKFQSHRRTKFQFDKGVNVITGSSDAGKSSVIRACIWVFDNRPPGDSIKNWDAEERDKVKVSIKFADAKDEITKERLRGKSKYLIGDMQFEALKQDVPDEVTALANLSDCNIQTQHDPYFLLNESPGEVARRLNEIVGLDIIDTIFKNLDRRIRTVSGAIKIHNETAERLEGDIKALGYVDDLYNEVIALKEKQDSLTKLEASTVMLKTLLGQIESVEKELIELKAPLEAEPHVLALLTKIKEFDKFRSSFVDLTSLAASLKAIEGTIESEKEWLECETLHSKLVLLATSYVTINVSMKKLRKLVEEISCVDEQSGKGIYKLESYLSEYADLLKKAKVCPICKSKISVGMIEEIVREL